MIVKTERARKNLLFLHQRGSAMRKRYLFILLLAFSAVCVIAQPVTITPPSANIQPGESVTLTASGATYYQWSPAMGLSTTEGPVVVASPTVTTTYTCSGYAPGAESVTNGDFSQGNTGFTSAYEYNTNLWNEGTYYVDNDASLHHENFFGQGHGDNGNFMIVNGATSPNTNVWTEQITVQPNKYYAFSTWVCTLAGQANEVALLQFSINGIQIGEVFSAPPERYIWEQFYELWFSGSATSATITILNQNTGGSGNDFGLDDISFRELVLVGAPECTVYVGSMSASATADDNELCESESTTLHALPVNGSGNYTYNWTPANTLDNPTSPHPVATPNVGTTTYYCHIVDVDWNNSQDVNVGITVHPSYDETTIDAAICSGESYNFFGTSIDHSVSNYPHTLNTNYGCDSIVRLNLTVYDQPVADAGEDQNLPYPGLTAQLSGSGGSDSFSYHWEPADMVVNPNSPSTQTVVLNEPRDYEFVLTVTNPQGQCISTDQTIIHVGTSALTVLADTPDPICEGESTQLQVDVSGGSGDFSYSWTPITGLNNPNIPNPIASPTQSTSYRCIITDNIAGYTGDINVAVTVNMPKTRDADTIRGECDVISGFWEDEQGNKQPYEFHNDTTYTFEGLTTEGCHLEQTFYIKNMKYSLNPDKIQPYPNNGSTVWTGYPDPNVNDTVYVVTNTEFFSFQYTFRVKETIHDTTGCLWNSCKWSISKPSWAIDTIPGGVKIQNDTCYSECTVYVADRDDDYVTLTAIMSNSCDIDTCKIFLKSSFLDIDEQNAIQSDFSVIPNPNNGQMTLAFNRFEGKVDIKVYDAMGNLIDSFVTYNDMDPKTLEYDLRVRKGIYFFVANGKGGTVAKKVIIR